MIPKMWSLQLPKIRGPCVGGSHNRDDDIFLSTYIYMYISLSLSLSLYVCGYFYFGKYHTELLQIRAPCFGEIPYKAQWKNFLPHAHLPAAVHLG